MIQAPGRSKRSVLPQVFYGNMGERFCGVFDEISKDRFVIVANYENLFDFRNFCDRPEAMLDNGMTSNFKKRLVHDQHLKALCQNGD